MNFLQPSVATIKSRALPQGSHRAQLVPRPTSKPRRASSGTAKQNELPCLISHGNAKYSQQGLCKRQGKLLDSRSPLFGQPLSNLTLKTKISKNKCRTAVKEATSQKLSQSENGHIPDWSQVPVSPCPPAGRWLCLNPSSLREAAVPVTPWEGATVTRADPTAPLNTTPASRIILMLSPTNEQAFQASGVLCNPKSLRHRFLQSKTLP